jgi:hypothetical protein
MEYIHKILEKSGSVGDVFKMPSEWKRVINWVSHYSVSMDYISVFKVILTMEETVRLSEEDGKMLVINNRLDLLP